MEIAVQDMPIIRRKKRPPKKKKDHRLQDNFVLKKKKKKKRTKLAVQDMPGKGKTTKKEMNRDTNKKSISMTFTDPYISL